MSQPGKGIVPKFGSFKPKTTARDPGVQEPNPHKESEDRHRQRSRSRSRQRLERKRSKSPSREDRKHHGERKDHDSRHDKKALDRARTASPKITKDEFEESDLFIIDRRGDAKNVQFGSLHRYDIPAHYRFGNGRIVGTPRGIRIDRDASTEKQVVLQVSDQKHGVRVPRPLASKSKPVESRGVRLIVPTQTDESAVNDDYIELRSSLKRKRGSESPEPAIEGVDYRSIEGKAKASGGPDDEDMEFATDSDDGELENGAQRESREKNATLNKAVKDGPGNIDAWLTLVDHQSNMTRPGSDPSMFSTSEKRSLADIRLAIYERALKSVSKTKPGYDTLVLGRLKEGSSIWENSKLVTKWNEALKDNPTSIRLWIKYLDFVQTDHINFRYERCKAVYVKCLRMLNEAHGRASLHERAKITSAQLYVLVRFTSFARDAGYEELAHAVWQILLEYHFFKPSNLSGRAEELESLEAFWESDVPRIGEEGAIGWNGFQTDSSQVSRKSVQDHTDERTSKLIYGAFAERESRYMDSGFLPAAADDDAESDDPFRFVMFADLKDIVENLLVDLPHVELVDAFLCSIQLPSVRRVEETSSQSALWTDQFLRKPTYGSQTNDVSTLADLIKAARLKNEKSTPFSMFHYAFKDRQINSAAVGFLDRVLQSLISKTSENDDLAEYHLAFLLRFFPDKAAKSAKRLLKSRPSSLLLYNAYALIEDQLGHNDKAEQVWATALSMSAAWPEEKREDAILLTHSRMRARTQHGVESEAVVYLMDSRSREGRAIVNNSEVSATDRLKAMRALDEGFQSTHATALPQHAALYVDCLAWLSYMADGRSLTSALSIYEKYASMLSPINDLFTLELLHQARANLLKWHIENKRPYRPAVSRDILAESIRLFPANSLFHEAQLMVSVQNRIDDRLREAFQTDAGQHAKMGIVAWCYTVAREIERCNADGSGATANSVRALFIKALLQSDSEVKHSPFKWTLWFHFERIAAEKAETSSSISTSSESGMQKVSQVFYNGLRHLPWYKPWIIMGMRLLPRYQGGSERELQQLYEVMTEREMRIRAEIER